MTLADVLNIKCQMKKRRNKLSWTIDYPHHPHSAGEADVREVQPQPGAQGDDRGADLKGQSGKRQRWQKRTCAKKCNNFQMNVS